MSRIVVIGGHGKVALQLARILTERGDEVTSVFRNPAHADDVATTGARPVVADIETLDTDALAELLAGHDAVVFSAGAGGGNPARTYAVDRDAAIRVIDAARQAGSRRFVMVSYFGAGPDHGVAEDNSYFPYAEAKAAADAHLRDSDLDWTVLGPAALPSNRRPVGSPSALGRVRCRGRTSLWWQPPRCTKILQRSAGPSNSTTATCPSPRRWPPGNLHYAAGLPASSQVATRVMSASRKHV